MFTYDTVVFLAKVEKRVERVSRFKWERECEKKRIASHCNVNVSVYITFF